MNNATTINPERQYEIELNELIFTASTKIEKEIIKDHIVQKLAITNRYIELIESKKDEDCYMKRWYNNLIAEKDVLIKLLSLVNMQLGETDDD